MSEGMGMPESQRLDELRDRLGQMISEFITLAAEANPDRPDQPIVLGWVVGVEWTSIELERSQQGARDLIAPNSQMLSASAGLGAYIAGRF